MSEDESLYDRDLVVKTLTAYYETLARTCYFSPSDIKRPPPEGWSDSELDVDALRALQRSEKAIDLLRHIPYIEPLEQNQEPLHWPIFKEERPVRYLRDRGDFSQWSSRGEEGLAELSALSFDKTPAGPIKLPPDAVSLTLYHGSRDPTDYRELPCCIIDCGTGAFTRKIRFNKRRRPTKETYRDLVEFFDEKTSQLTRCEVFPVPPVEGYAPELMSRGEDELMNELVRHVEGVYSTFGWRDSEELAHFPVKWRRGECMSKLRRFRVSMREADKKKAEYESEEENDEAFDSDDVDWDDDGEATSSDESDVDMEDAPSPREELAEELSVLREERKRRVDFQGPSLPDYGYDRDAIADVFTRYYELLSRMAYFPPSLVRYPPEHGWPDELFPVDKLQKLGYSERVIDLLRHLPYLSDDGYYPYWPLFGSSKAVRYLRDADTFGKIPDKYLERKRLYKLHLSPFEKEILPRDMVAISTSPEDRRGSMGTWFLIDTERAILYVTDHWDQQNLYDEKPEKPWLSGKIMPVVPYMERLIADTQSLKIVPMPGENVETNMFPDIWAEPDWSLGAKVLCRLDQTTVKCVVPNDERWAIEDARNTYRKFGWPNVQRFRRKACIKALSALHSEVVYARSYTEDEEEEETDGQDDDTEDDQANSHSDTAEGN